MSEKIAMYYVPIATELVVNYPGWKENLCSRIFRLLLAEYVLFAGF
jgi:hypothetical protein